MFSSYPLCRPLSTTINRAGYNTPSSSPGHPVVLLYCLTYEALAGYHPNYQRHLYYRAHRFRAHLFFSMRIFLTRCFQLGFVGAAWMTNSLRPMRHCPNFLCLRVFVAELLQTIPAVLFEALFGKYLLAGVN